MSAISSLLNPSKDTDDDALPSPSMSAISLGPTAPTPASLASPPLKKQRLAKDAAIFTQGKVRGEIRYPPFEEYSAEINAELEKFAIHPLGRIAQFRRHIPYNSDKKDFMEKTARDAFEVFQYTFKLPEDEKQKEYVVMWDYNIGLVRITPFFKCLQYSKTVPSKMMNNNPGLKEICHSITGGSLAAQGYWMPFEAAKAVAATFCYSIRYALIPIFGSEFPSSCTPPSDESFAHMVIDPRIVRRCTQRAQEYREEYSRETTAAASQATTPVHSGTWTPINCRSQTPQAGSWAPINARSQTTQSSDAMSESAGSDNERERRREYLPSPNSMLFRGPPPRSTPNNRTLPPLHSHNPLTKAALDAHEHRMRQRSPVDEGNDGPRHDTRGRISGDWDREAVTGDGAMSPRYHPRDGEMRHEAHMQDGESSPRTRATENAASYSTRRRESGEVSPRTVPRDLRRVEHADKRTGWCVVNSHRPVHHAQTQVEGKELGEPLWNLDRVHERRSCECQHSAESADRERARAYNEQHPRDEGSVRGEEVAWSYARHHHKQQGMVPVWSHRRSSRAVPQRRNGMLMSSGAGTATLGAVPPSGATSITSSSVPRPEGQPAHRDAATQDADLAHDLAATFHVPPLLSLVDGSMTIAEARAAATLWRMRLDDQTLDSGEVRPRKRRWSSMSYLME